MRRFNERKKKKTGLDIEQIYGHGFQRGPMPGVTMPAISFCFCWPTAYTKDRPVLSSEMAPHKNNTVIVNV
jgi:hypothetical protein